MNRARAPSYVCQVRHKNGGHSPPYEFPARVAAVLVAVAACLPVNAQPSQPAATRSASTLESDRAGLAALPPEIRRTLADEKDHQLDFDTPGFYAAIEHLKTHGVPRAVIDAAPAVDDWSALVEHPTGFRGMAVTIEGVVGHNKSFAILTPEKKSRFGDLWQLELTRAGQPLPCTVILTQSAADIGLNSTVVVTGYFIKVRRFLTPRNDERPAVLLVAEAPTSVSRQGPPPDRESRWDIRWGLATIVAAAVFVWMVLRRAGRRGTTDLHAIQAGKPAPMDLSADLEQWAGHDPAEDGRPPGGP